MPAISVRLETRSSAKTGGERMHNERLNDAPIYIASERTCDNSVLVPMPTAAALSRECLRRRRAAFEPGPAPSGQPKRMPQGMASNAIISVAGLITFSTDAQPSFEALPFDEQNKRFMEAAAAVGKQYNTDVAALAVHRDESAVHAHFALHGFDHAGEPLSKQMTRAALSKSQDIGSQAFADLGITRGIPKADRIAAGESRSKTIHRTVHQLHSALPRELAEAQQRVDKMQLRVADVEGKLAIRERELTEKDAAAIKQDGKMATLEKRLKTYQNRLESRTEEVERLGTLVNEKTTEIAGLDKQLSSKKTQLRKLGTSIDLPKPKTSKIAQKPAKKGLLGKAKQPEPQFVHYYLESQVQELFGGLKNIADTERDNHLRLAKDIQDRTRDYQHVRETRSQNLQSAKRSAVGQALVQRYGLIVTETDKQVTVPPQNPSTPAQIAAALYRSSREKWPTAHFTVNDEVANQLIKMTVQDNRSDVVSFDNIAQSGRLLTAQKLHESENQEPKKARLTTTEPRRAWDIGNAQLDDWDDSPSGPGN